MGSEATESFRKAGTTKNAHVQRVENQSSPAPRMQ